MTIHNDPPEKDLFKLFCQNDKAAIEKIYREYFHYCTSMVTRTGGQKADSQDVFQNALIVLYNRSRDPEFQLNAQLKTYLYSVCWKIWGNEMKKRGRQNESLDDDKKHPVDKPDHLENFEAVFLEMDENNYLQNVTMKILKEMKEQCRNIILWYYSAHLSMDEIAEALVISKNQLKDRKYRCMQNFMERIRPFLDDL